MLLEVTFQDKKGLTETTEQGRTLTEEQRELIRSAEDILRTVQAHICRKNVYLQVFTELLRWAPVEEDILLETDGLHLFYQPERLITEAKKRRLPELERRLLHILCHGILGHFGMRRQVEEKNLADPAMDMEAERLGVGLGWWQIGSGARNRTSEGQTGAVADALRQMRGMGARRMYHFSRFHSGGRSFLEDYAAEKRWGDDHDVWDRREKYTCRGELPDALADGAEGPFAKTVPAEAEQEWEKARMLVFGTGGVDADQTKRRLEDGQRGKLAGSGTASDSGQVRAAAENGRSYREVLEQFFRERECFQDRDDTIDRMLYTYGFEQYGDIALIEPEECCEVRKLHTVAIAIDTSGSCSGPIMESFLRETRNILRDIRAEGSFEEILFFQCDMKIQQECVFRDPEELPESDTFVVRGAGGTDFCPLFSRLWELERQREMTIDCLLFLTDGYGCFPAKAPDFPTFLILPDGENDILPAWAEKIRLDEAKMRTDA